MTPSTCLFDTRGGSLNAHICEVCNEDLALDSLYPVCEECLQGENEEDNES